MILIEGIHYTVSELYNIRKLAIHMAKTFHIGHTGFANIDIVDCPNSQCILAVETLKLNNLVREFERSSNGARVA